MFTIYILNKFKKRIFAKKLIRNIQTFITKKVLKIFQIFFLYSVQGDRCGIQRKFHADRRIFKHCKKSAKMSDSFPTRRRERVKLIKSGIGGEKDTYLSYAFRRHGQLYPTELATSASKLSTCSQPVYFYACVWLCPPSYCVLEYQCTKLFMAECCSY